MTENACRTESTLSGLENDLFVSHPQPMWVYDLETLRFLAVNDAAVAHYGYSRDEFLHLTIREIRPPEDVSRLEKNIAEIQGGIDRAGIWRHRRKDGSLILVEVTSHTITWNGRAAEIVWAHDVTSRINSEIRLGRINEALLSFGLDFQANINRLTALCGELLGAACALYNRMKSGMLCSLGTWNTPADYNPVDKPDGHICYDVIRKAGCDCLVVRDLQNSPYAASDPNVCRYNLHTYIGKAVRAAGATVGSLCVVFQRDVVPTDEDLRVITIIASAIGTEESRLDAETNLMEREEKYRILFEVESDALFLIDNEDGRLVEANKAAVQMYGYTHEELLKMRNVDLSAEPQQTTAVTRSNPPDPGTVVNIPLRWHRKKDGTVFPVEITGRFFLQNGRGVHIAAIRDISHRQKAEQALRESEQNYRTIFNSTNEAIFVHDPESGRILDVNSSMLRMYGFESKEELIGRDIGDLSANTPPYTRQEAITRIRKTLSEEAQVFEWLSRRKNGETFWTEVSLRGTPLGGRDRVLAVVRDISERKRLEEQLLQSQKMESVGRLAGGVAHDFNNMLTVILGRCELALAHLKPDHPLHHDFQDIQQVAKRSAQLTQQLLAFARKQLIAPKSVQINHVVEGMLRMLQRLIGEDITLRWVPGPKLWTVRLDPAQVDQVLANLLVNARDAISGNGLITIATRNVVHGAADRDEHPDLPLGEYVLLAVTDNGAGMTPEVRQKIFDPFFTTKEFGKGTGLGLATVYGIVRQNDGLIEVKSSPGQGSTFSLYFPREHENSPHPSINTEKVCLPTGTEHIVVVEDDSAILAIIKQLLERLGYRVRAYESPIEALKSMDELTERVDLLITDVIMPELNGRQMYDRMRRRLPDLKCLYVSGYTADVIAERGLLDERCPFLQKPFQSTDLACKVRSLLDEKEARE